ncbi:hydrolase [Parashewanella curva]|uniref:Hydrolase n=1 Tax=Parashewanella curva TaxID=2338552 RepID=A0A3L8PVQ0_9GAMM|nr:MBL fold metallo-hydrolase [Parashewanella curva]RLV59440.1 hydrolase [Parashewanella curva]
MKIKMVAGLIVIVGVVMLNACINKHNQPAEVKTKFQNSEWVDGFSFTNMLGIIKDYMTVSRKESVPTEAIPVAEIDADALNEETQDVVFKLGHSSLLFKLSGSLIMADPVFSERASPLQWMGPKRFHQPPITVDTLPNIDVVVISHDHYDHLDKAALAKLANKTQWFLVPLKVGKHLEEVGVSKDKIIELAWWQSQTINGIEYTLTPTQHFSGRGLFDKDTTLWGSWVINTGKQNLYFSGDSGYFSGFKEIGEKYGPFDLTFIETGAYNKRWSKVHMFPEQSVQAHLDLKGKVMMPIHNSTFDLALHDWHEPLDRVLKESNDKKIRLITPTVGQRVELSDLLRYENQQRWWK